MKYIKVNYLYRDGGNWKEFGSFSAPNPESKCLEEFERELRARCVDGTFFYHEEWDVPPLFPDSYDPDTDPTWHELESVEEV